jgi:hypothetical protein
LSGGRNSYLYSTNPADVAVDCIYRFYLQRNAYSDAVALDKLQRRVDWQSYTDFWNYCQSLITWNDGTNPTRQIKRFECHVVFTGEVSLADALDQVCATAATFWQDDGERIRFITPDKIAPVHHFHYDPTDTSRKSNIVADSFSIVPRDIRERVNFLTVKFRNLDDTYLGEVKVEVSRPDLIKRVGKIASERTLPNMYISQAQRLLERQMRLEADNPILCTLRGLGDSFHVLPGDFVTVTHPVANWKYQRCLVIEAGPDSAEKTADECAFTLQKIDGDLYVDTDHKPVQTALTP